MINLKPFRFWCQKVLPLVYDDSLSYYELLCKVVEYLNNVILDTVELQQLFTELKDYVENYFNNLSVQEEINNKLDQMAENGELALLLKDAVLYTLDFYRIGRVIEDEVIQGVCFGKDGVIVYSTASGSVVKISSAGVQLQKVTNSLFSHANSLAFDGDSTIYLAPNDTYYVTLNYEDLDIIEKIDTDFTVSSVAIDNKTGRLYFMDNTSSLAEIRDSDGLVCTINNGNAIPQGFAVFSSNIYILTSVPSVIRVYDLQGDILLTHNVPYMSETYISGEIEDIDFKENGEFILVSDVDLRTMVMNQFFVGNVKGGIISPNSFALSSIKPNQYIYVDINSTAFNPNGSADSKYKYLSEALISCESNIFAPVYINVGAGTYDERVIIFNPITLVLNGNAYFKRIEAKNADLAVIGNLYLTGEANYAHINAINSRLTITSVSASGSGTYFLNAQASKISIHSLANSGTYEYTPNITLNQSELITPFNNVAKERSISDIICVQTCTVNFSHSSAGDYSSIKYAMQQEYFSYYVLGVSLYFGQTAVMPLNVGVARSTIKYLVNNENTLQVSVPFEINTYKYCYHCEISFANNKLTVTAHSVTKDSEAAPTVSPSIEQLICIA